MIKNKKIITEETKKVENINPQDTIAILNEIERESLQDIGEI